METGYERNYAEGAAYRDYFATDRLMFEVPTSDTRLRNKAEVLVLRSEILGKDARPVAIAVERLRREPVYFFAKPPGGASSSSPHRAART